MKKIIKYSLIVVLAVLITVGTKYGISYAKYAYNSVWNYYLESKRFFFSSDSLEQNGKVLTDNLWDGEPIYFDLRNNLNDSVSSDVDISYKVTCKVKNSSIEAKCTILDTNSDVYEGILSTFKTCTNETGDGVDVKKYDKATCEMGNYTWDNQIAIKNVYFNIVSEYGEVESADVEIKAESIAPYKKTITANYVLNRDKNPIGSVDKIYTDKGEKGFLILSNSFEEDKCMRLSWNSDELKIDLDKNKIKTYATDTSGYINEIDFKLESKSSIKYDFFEVIMGTYDREHFTITEIGQC